MPNKAANFSTAIQASKNHPHWQQHQQTWVVLIVIMISNNSPPLVLTSSCPSQPTSANSSNSSWIGVEAQQVQWIPSRTSTSCTLQTISWFNLKSAMAAAIIRTLSRQGSDHLCFQVPSAEALLIIITMQQMERRHFFNSNSMLGRLLSLLLPARLLKIAANKRIMQQSLALSSQSRQATSPQLAPIIQAMATPRLLADTQQQPHMAVSFKPPALTRIRLA